jgi:hypothetical protein
MMIRKLLLLWLFCLFMFRLEYVARRYTKIEARAAWKELKVQPIIEKNFRNTCDLIQDIGQTDIHLSYEIIQQFLVMILNAWIMPLPLMPDSDFSAPGMLVRAMIWV